MEQHPATVGAWQWVVVRLITITVLLVAVPINASITRSEPRDGVGTDAFNAVGTLTHTDTPGSIACSAVAVLDGRHILTTRHCVTASGVIVGETRDASGFRFEAAGVTYRGVEVFADFGGDLALIRLDGVAPDAFGLWDIETQGSEQGLDFQGVGFGVTDSDGDGQWGPGGDGVKRVFTNRVDEIADGTIAGQGPVLRYDFDLTPGSSGDSGVGELEGIHGPGDSGGGAFIVEPLDGNTLLLAGLMSSAGDPVNGATGSLIQVSNYREAITAAVPEPSAALMLAVGSILAFKRRRA